MSAIWASEAARVRSRGCSSGGYAGFGRPSREVRSAHVAGVHHAIVDIDLAPRGGEHGRSRGWRLDRRTGRGRVEASAAKSGRDAAGPARGAVECAAVVDRVLPRRLELDEAPVGRRASGGRGEFLPHGAGQQRVDVARRPERDVVPVLAQARPRCPVRPASWSAPRRARDRRRATAPAASPARCSPPRRRARPHRPDSAGPPRPLRHHAPERAGPPRGRSPTRCRPARRPGFAPRPAPPGTADRARP